MTPPLPPGITIEPEHFTALADDIHRNKQFLLSDGERCILLVPVQPESRVQ